MLYVPVGPLRDRFLKLINSGEVTTNEVALRCGWIRSDTGAPDSTRVRRALGLKKSLARGGETRRQAQTQVRYETAVLLAQALHMDPHEAGV
jgi:hypothetical protein